MKEGVERTDNYEGSDNKGERGRTAGKEKGGERDREREMGGGRERRNERSFSTH